MIFSSFDFLFRFLPLFLILYFICPEKWRNQCLFAGSLIFYFYGARHSPLYFVLFLLSIPVNFFIGQLIERKRDAKERSFWLNAGIFYNLFWLILFKYSTFITENLNLLLSYTKTGLQFPVIRLSLPLGISFYTFQAISYLADVYRKEAFHETSLINYGMYITMFPQLIAGPIVTYASVRKQIHRRSHNLKNAENGLREFTIGLGLKVLLANQVGRLWSQVGAIGYESISTPLAWPRSAFRFTLILMATP